jgi:ribosomal protein S18 acetylase RimI-like enzyme
MTADDETFQSASRHNLRLRQKKRVPRSGGAEPDDQHIASIHCLSWQDAYRDILDQAFLDGPIEEDRMSLWSKRLGDPPSSQITSLAERDTEPVGFICAFSDADAQWSSLINNIHVKPGLRGQGVGRYLLRAAAQTIADEAEAKGLHLWRFVEMVQHHGH